MATIKDELKAIEIQRKTLLHVVKQSQTRLAELNTQRQNLIMSPEE